MSSSQQATLQGPFKPNAAASVDVPEAPFGDRGLHVAFFRQEDRVELNGCFSTEQIRILLTELERRAAAAPRHAVNATA